MMGWLLLTNLPQKVYPRPVYLFYLHLRPTEGAVGENSLTSYVKGKLITLNPHTLAQIIGVQSGNLQCHFQSEADLVNMVSDVSEVYTTICENQFTGTNLQVRHLKPHLRILHRWIVENVTPEKGHFDTVPFYNVYLLYCFEVGQTLDLCYILLKEMVIANLGTLSGRSLPFGALLTKIFKAHHVSLVGEVDVKISSPISEYTLTRAGGVDNLLGSINVANELIADDPEDPNDNVMPPNQQPQYWTDYFALEQERHNQRIQWEQQMENQFNALGNRFDAFAAAQNSLIQQFGEFRVDTERCDEVTSNNCIDQIDHRVTQVYHYYFPPPPPPPDNDA
ncbi:hypothetical protein ACSBR1_002205 [Camellia fascicularis]